MVLSPLLMQLEMGMSMSRYLPATGTAGLDRDRVRGKSREPRPPPRMRARTERMGFEPRGGPGTWGPCEQRGRPGEKMLPACHAERKPLRSCLVFCVSCFGPNRSDYGVRAP